MKTASELSKWPPSCPSHLTCHFHGYPCSSSLTPGHCPGDLLTTPMATACNTGGTTDTQSAFQAKLLFMSWGSPSLCLPGGWPSVHFPLEHFHLQRALTAAETEVAVPGLSPLSKSDPSLHACFLPLGHTNTSP